MLDAASFQQAFGAALSGTSAIVPDTQLARALAVHRNTSAKAAQDALADNFPVIRTLVGEDAFPAAAALFAERSPPTDPRLCLYGAGFPAFLSIYPPFAETSALPEMRYLSDVATVEWFAIEALFAADAVALDGAAFGEGPDLERSLRLHPAARHARLASPAGSLWRAHAADDVDAALGAIDWVGEVVLVTRPVDALIVTILPPGGASFLDACRDGRSLGEAAMACGDDLLAVFAALIAAGTFA